MQFDPKSNKYKPLMKYMEGKTCLVFDPVSTVRQTVIKLMKTFDVPGMSIYHDAKDFEKVSEIIVNKQPNFVFLNTKIDESKGISLFKIYQKVMSNKLDGGFFLMSEDNSLADAALILDHDIDGYLAQPYTFDNILETFCNSLFKKIKKDNYTICLEKAKAAYILDDYEGAAQRFEKALGFGMPTADHSYYQGLNFLALKEPELAKNSFQSGVELMPTHYRCLNALVDLNFSKKNYKEAYKSMVTILENYPLNPEKIPMLTKISISNQKYEDIYRYAQLFLELPDKSSTIQKYLVAGLVLCGKFMLMNKENKKATKTFLDAAKLSDGRKEVLLQIVISLSDVGLFDHATNILTKYSSKSMEVEDYMHLQLEILIRQDKPSMIFKTWAQITSDGPVLNPRLFEIVLEASKQADLGETQVESLYDDAIASFPDKSEDFRKIIAA